MDDVSPNLSENLDHTKKKSLSEDTEESSSQSDFGESVGPVLLPDNTNENDVSDNAVSEHLSLNSEESIENDCFYEEIEISNILSNSPLLNTGLSDEDDDQNSACSLNQNFVAESILNEILCKDAFKSDSEETVLKSTESFNLFVNVNLNDSLVNLKSVNYDKLNETSIVGADSKFEHLEDLSNSKDDAISALNIDLESLRELTSSNQSTLSLNTSTTEYKVYQDEFQHRIVQYQNALVHRDNLIQQLTEALQESVINREQLQNQSQQFTKEIDSLNKQLSETAKIVLQLKSNILEKSVTDAREEITLVAHTPENSIQDGFQQDFNEQYSLLEETLNLSQIELLKKLRGCINVYVEQKMYEYKNSNEIEMKTMKDKSKQEKMQYDNEVVKLRHLLSTLQCEQADIVAIRENLEHKHAQELEELRIYFENKCADLEKQYSEEVFSQQSRKLSGSTSSLDMSDFVCSASLPFHGPGGDNLLLCSDDLNIKPINYSNITKDDLLKLKITLNKLSRDLDKYKLDNIGKQELNQLKADLEAHGLASIIKFDILALRKELQNKYNTELEILREDYENKIDAITVENNNHIHNLEKKYVEQINLLKNSLDNDVGNINTSNQEVILVANTADDTEWPSELLQLRSRFTEKYEKQIEELEKKHKKEVTDLKRELNNNNNNSDVLKERDNLERTAHTLRNLVGVILKYFSECENELNNTLVEELLKQGFYKDPTDLEDCLNESTNSTSNEASSSKKRVHFTPKFDDLLAKIDSSFSSSLDSNISFGLRNELSSCLQRLRSDANEVLSLSATANKVDQVLYEDVASLQEKVSSLSNQLLTENRIKKNLTNQLTELNIYITSLETEQTNSEHQIEQLIEKNQILESNLEDAQLKITQLIEDGHKEVISEGYVHKCNTDSITPTMLELQERVKSMAIDLGISNKHSFMNVVDELCKQGDRINEEAKYNREDLQQQIEAADKKLRAITKFLEEQAAEREHERDESQKEIALLREQLRESEKDHVNCDLVYTEVEQLEKKMRQISNMLEENDKRLDEVELEKKEAIEKVFFLRDIIRGLESDIETKSDNETKLRNSITQLKDIIQQQNKLNEELSQRLGPLTSTSEVQQYQDHIGHLEDEVERLRINKEFAGSEGALKQIKAELNEFEMSIDKCTHDLEVLYSAVCTTTCSSPSEDVSVRDQIKASNSALSDEYDIPLQQLSRLKEKLIKHSRAEDTAIKRIRDLEMELTTYRNDYNEIQNERDLLQDQVSEQLALMASLQIRLDDQRLRADHVQKQNNISLETRIYDLENEVKDLMEIINKKDKEIKNLNKIVDEIKTKLLKQEQQINSNDNEMIIQKLQSENAILQAKINSDAQSAQVLPGLVDNILSDKNRDIEMLRNKLDKTETELNLYQSLKFDHEHLKVLSRLQNSDRAFFNILSLVDVDARKVNRTTESLNTSLEMPHIKNPENETLSAPEISSIEKVGEQNNIYNSMETSLIKANSTEIKSAEKKKVHFEDTAEIIQLEKELADREEIIAQYVERIKTLVHLETTIKELQLKLESTEKDLIEATSTFQQGQYELKEVRVALAENQVHLMEKEQQLESYIQDAGRKDRMYMSLAKEKQQLETILKNQNAKVEKINELENIILEKQANLDNLHSKLLALDNKDIKNQESQCDEVNEETRVLKQTVFDEIGNLQYKLQTQALLEDKIKELERLIIDRETEIEILNEDAGRYQDDILKLENKIKILGITTNNNFELTLAKKGHDIAARNLQIEKLKSEVQDLKIENARLGDLICDKDTLIKQMANDSKNLHLNLETIQAKLGDSENVDLKKRIQEEQVLNKQLHDELAQLRLQTAKPIDMTTSIDEITGAVCKQLDYSAHLDSNILNAVGVCDLEELLEQEKAKNLQLQAVLEKQQVEDSEMLEKLRLRLEDALKNEVEFSKMLQHEKHARQMLERQIQEVKKCKSTLHKNTEHSSLPNLNVQDIIRLTKEVQILLEENSKLKDEIRNLKSSKAERGANMKYFKYMLQLKTEEVAKLENQLKELGVCEINTKEALVSCKVDLEQRRHEVENSRLLIGELEEEGREMKLNIVRLKDLLQKTKGKENNTSEQLGIPERQQFVHKIKELTDLSNSLIQDNKKLSNEKNLLQKRISELQGENAAIHTNVPYDNPVVRANYLFAKYLRSNSYRKALVFQKNYLIQMLVSYQAHPFIPQQLTLLSQFRKSRLITFRITALSVIAIIRMQYLVQRWNSGKRAYQLNIPKHHTTFQIGLPVSQRNFTGTFHTNSPTIVNCEPNFLPANANNSSINETIQESPPSSSYTNPWSGTTPPIKERINVFGDLNRQQKK